MIPSPSRRPGVGSGLAFLPVFSPTPADRVWEIFPCGPRPDTEVRRLGIGGPQPFLTPRQTETKILPWFGVFVRRRMDCLASLIPTEGVQEADYTRDPSGQFILHKEIADMYDKIFLIVSAKRRKREREEVARLQIAGPVKSQDGQKGPSYDKVGFPTEHSRIVARNTPSPTQTVAVYDESFWSSVFRIQTIGPRPQSPGPVPQSPRCLKTQGPVPQSRLIITSPDLSKTFLRVLYREMRTLGEMFPETFRLRSSGDMVNQDGVHFSQLADKFTIDSTWTYCINLELADVILAIANLLNRKIDKMKKAKNKPENEELKYPVHVFDLEEELMSPITEFPQAPYPGLTVSRLQILENSYLSYINDVESEGRRSPKSEECPWPLVKVTDKERAGPGLTLTEIEQEGVDRMYNFLPGTDTTHLHHLESESAKVVSAIQEGKIQAGREEMAEKLGAEPHKDKPYRKQKRENRRPVKKSPRGNNKEVRNSVSKSNKVSDDGENEDKPVVLKSILKKDTFWTRLNRFTETSSSNKIATDNVNDGKNKGDNKVTTETNIADQNKSGANVTTVGSSSKKEDSLPVSALISEEKSSDPKIDDQKEKENERKNKAQVTTWNDTAMKKKSRENVAEAASPSKKKDSLTVLATDTEDKSLELEDQKKTNSNKEVSEICNQDGRENADKVQKVTASKDVNSTGYVSSTDVRTGKGDVINTTTHCQILKLDPDCPGGEESTTGVSMGGTVHESQANQNLTERGKPSRIPRRITGKIEAQGHDKDRTNAGAAKKGSLPLVETGSGGNLGRTPDVTQSQGVLPPARGSGGFGLDDQRLASMSKAELKEYKMNELARHKYALKRLEAEKERERKQKEREQQEEKQVLRHMEYEENKRWEEKEKKEKERERWEKAQEKKERLEREKQKEREMKLTQKNEGQERIWNRRMNKIPETPSPRRNVGSQNITPLPPIQGVRQNTGLSNISIVSQTNPGATNSAKSSPRFPNLGKFDNKEAKPKESLKEKWARKKAEREERAEQARIRKEQQDKQTLQKAQRTIQEKENRSKAFLEEVERNLEGVAEYRGTVMKPLDKDKMHLKLMERSRTYREQYLMNNPPPQPQNYTNYQEYWDEREEFDDGKQNNGEQLGYHDNRGVNTDYDRSRQDTERLQGYTDNDRVPDADYHGNQQPSPHPPSARHPPSSPHPPSAPQPHRPQPPMSGRDDLRQTVNQRRAERAGTDGGVLDPAERRAREAERKRQERERKSREALERKERQDREDQERKRANLERKDQKRQEFWEGNITKSDQWEMQKSFGRRAKQDSQPEQNSWYVDSDPAEKPEAFPELEKRYSAKPKVKRNKRPEVATRVKLEAPRRPETPRPGKQGFVQKKNKNCAFIFEF